MGMTIEDSQRYLRLMLGGMEHAVRYWEDRDKEESDIEQTNVEAVKIAIDTMRKYQQFQADYENRLKADLVAMLEEIDLEMSEQSFGIQTEPWEVVEKLRKKIIQQKINSLKEAKDGLHT